MGARSTSRLGNPVRNGLRAGTPIARAGSCGRDPSGFLRRARCRGGIDVGSAYTELERRKSKTARPDRRRRPFLWLASAAVGSGLFFCLVIITTALVMVWVWHARPLFNAALANEWVHALQHLCFFGTAVLFWWGLVFGRYGRVGYGVSVLFVFATATHTSLLGVLLTVSERVFYSAYETSTGSLGLDPLDDQRLGGLVMWIPGGVTMLLASLALMLASLGEARRRVARASRADGWAPARNP
jgi:cytochrome c oxidase assembly factor CtaG